MRSIWASISRRLLRSIISDSGVDVLMQTAAEGKLAEQNVLYGAKLKSMGFTDCTELDRRRASMAG